jgi:uncharacterized hydrophobic protein (TIGR00271 family)
MIHLRIVAPPDLSERALELLRESPSVCNVIWLPGAAQEPEGDALLADVAREDASVVLSDLKELGIHEVGSIALEEVDTLLSLRAEKAVEHARGAPADAVVWEEVESRTSEQVELSGVYLAFMVLAALIAAVGIFLDSPILIVGAMVVGPEFGPIAGFCVALVQRRRDLAVRSFVALALGFPLAVAAVFLAAHVFRLTGLTPETFSDRDHQLSTLISSPDFFSFFVAACAGAAGMLSLSTAKSGALIGVLISVTTIPAAANVGLAAAYQDWPAWRGSVAQLAINLAAILLAGTVTLFLQRLLYRRRRQRHLGDRSRRAAGLPLGRRTTESTRSRPWSAPSPRPRR